MMEGIAIADELQRLSISPAGECDPRAALDLGIRLQESIASGGNWCGKNPGAIRAVLEILVRSCIYPHLSSGVGIPIKKRFKNDSAIAGAAKAASEMDSSRGGSRAGGSGFDPLYEAAEFLWKLFEDPSLVGTEFQQLLLSQHLPDLWAACFQLCYQASDEMKSRRALEMMDCFVEKLPVAHAVEAVMLLLVPENSPPAWLKLEAGKILSKLVMREGGVVAVLERLVGNAAEGDATAHKRVANHLGKCPKYVATAKDYYCRICTQILPLLSPPRPSNQIGESPFRAVRNLHQTAVTTVCIIARQDPEAVEAFVLDAVIDPILVWGTGKALEDKQQMQQSLLRLGALITAGDERIKQMIVRRTADVAPRLLLLHQLERSEDSSSAIDWNTYNAAVRDVVLLHLVQPAEHSLSICSRYIFKSIGEWWQEIERWEAQTPGRYMSELLLSTENWELSISLLSQILSRISELKQGSGAADDRFLRLINTLDEMLEMVGSRACEEHPAAANSLVKELLHCKETSGDAEFGILQRLK